MTARHRRVVATSFLDSPRKAISDEDRAVQQDRPSCNFQQHDAEQIVDVPRCLLGMRRVFLIALLLALSASQADARHHGFHRYRYWGHLPRGMVAAVPYAIGRSLQRSVQGNQFPPPTWQLQPPDPNWQGRRFVSPDGTAWLAFYASSADGEQPSAHLKAVAFVDGEEITALHANSDQLIVTGAKGDRTFYRKARIACGGQAWHHVALEFPFTTDRQQAYSYEMLVAQASRALDSADEQGCEGQTAESSPAERR